MAKADELRALREDRVPAVDLGDVRGELPTRGRLPPNEVLIPRLREAFDLHAQRAAQAGGLDTVIRINAAMPDEVLAALLAQLADDGFTTSWAEVDPDSPVRRLVVSWAEAPA